MYESIYMKHYKKYYVSHYLHACACTFMWHSSSLGIHVFRLYFRVVPEKQRAFGISVQWFILRFLGKLRFYFSMIVLLCVIPLITMRDAKYPEFMMGMRKNKNLQPALITECNTSTVLKSKWNGFESNLYNISHSLVPWCKTYPRWRSC